jgi:hypothetical protein
VLLSKEDAVTVAFRGFAALLLVGLVLVSATAVAQESKSASLAAELSRLLDDLKLDSFAARQDAADQFVGALYFPGSQLLVVSTKYSVPDRINYLLGQKAYKDAYADLSSASEQQAKIFVMDGGANGLQFKREANQPFDTVDLPGRSLAFDGEWGRGRISEDEYRKTFATTDEQYAQMLQALIAGLKKKP